MELFLLSLSNPIRLMSYRFKRSTTENISRFDLNMECTGYTSLQAHCRLHRNAIRHFEISVRPGNQFAPVSLRQTPHTSGSAKMANVGMREEHRTLLQKNRVALVKDLEPRKILNHLGQILDGDDREEVSTCRTRVDQAETLLDLLPKKGPDAFECFVRALLSKQRHLGELLLRGSGLSAPAETNGKINAF